MPKKYDFSGWATKNDLRCADGRTIRKNAFKDDDGRVVPLVWQHQHNSPYNVLGHAELQNRENGVYAYCSFNDTEMAKHAKSLVEHGDISQLSIYANQLQQSGGDVLHGSIKEVSLVLAGANPGACIEYPMLEHGEESEGEVYIRTGEFICHEDKPEENEMPNKETPNKEAPNKEAPNKEAPNKEELKKQDKTVKEIFDAMSEEKKDVVYYIIGELFGSDEDDSAESDNGKDISHADDLTDNADPNGNRTLSDILNSLTEEEKTVVCYVIGSIAKEKGIDLNEVDLDGSNEKTKSEGDDSAMKHNVFDVDEEMNNENTLTHDQESAIIADAKRYGSLKDSFLAHTEEYGIDHIDWLFPDYKTEGTAPEFIKREDGWVKKVMSGVHHLPFSRVRTRQADITADEARAKGYIKGKTKKNEVFTLIRRTTDPQTIYKKNKLDRDDIVDITDFDVVAWLKGEMRMMLDEEIARAILVGDGRESSDDDHISEDHVRSIRNDADLYAVKVKVTTPAGGNKYKELIKTVIRNRKKYKGTGNPVFFTTEDILSELLLIEDGNGRCIYDNVETLAKKLRVSDIITVPVMEGLAPRVDTDPTTHETTYFDLLGIMVNLADYDIGADKGGAVNMFDDFDIDVNQQKYLIETRCSGALAKVQSALVFEEEAEAPEDAGDEDEE